VRALDRRLLRRARPARALLAVDVALAVASTLLVLVQASLLAWVVAESFAGASLAEVREGLFLLVLTVAARAAIAWAFEVVGRRAAAGVLSELRLALVRHRLGERPVGLDRASAGELAATGVAGVDALGAYFGRYLPQVVLACLVPVAVLAWVAAVDLTSAIVMALTLPLVPVFMWLIGRYTEEQTRRRWTELTQLSTRFLELVRGLPTLRAFNRGRAQAGVIAELSDRHRRATMATLRVSFLSSTVLELAATLGVALVAVVVGVRLAGGGLGLQAGLTVLVLAPELYLPLRRLGAEFHASADGLAVAERLLARLEEPPEVSRRGARRTATVVPVCFDGVSYAYPARPGRVLDGLDLELRAGETVALVGPSGAGKSTAAALLLRLLEPTGGTITAGGVDLGCLDIDAWRRRLSWVPQRPTLFRGSVADGIRLGDPSADDRRVRSAARAAGADSFVRALPDGYGTLIGDGGRELSAGQRTRIALARALLREAPLLILDEPTANLDEESAAVVAAAIERLHGERTVLLIAHRSPLVGLADRIVALAPVPAVDDRVRAAA
jgi:thiol reductant ABC exporter CydD subunit